MLDLDDVRWELGRFGKLKSVTARVRGARAQAALGAADQRRGPQVPAAASMASDLPAGLAAAGRIRSTEMTAG
jgi:hypothetical protein